MFEWLFGKKEKFVEEEIRKSFDSVKNDMNNVGKWIKHLDNQDKQLFEALESVKNELSTIKKDIENIRVESELGKNEVFGKQLFKKLPVLNEQTAVQAVQTPVQTPVQTANFYDILKNLTSNERLVVLALLNNDMKLSYKDLAILLGKESATVRGQINAIKQKSGGLIEEIIEKNGKKRVFIPDEIKEKMRKFAKVRVGGSKK